MFRCWLKVSRSWWFESFAWLVKLKVFLAKRTNSWATSRRTSTSAYALRRLCGFIIIFVCFRFYLMNAGGIEREKAKSLKVICFFWIIYQLFKYFFDVFASCWFNISGSSSYLLYFISRKQPFVGYVGLRHVEKCLVSFCFLLLNIFLKWKKTQNFKMPQSQIIH